VKINYVSFVYVSLFFNTVFDKHASLHYRDCPAGLDRPESGTELLVPLQRSWFGHPPQYVQRNLILILDF
jgi:hypothetical protein